MNSAESLVTVLVAVVGSGGLWGTLQLLLNRHGRRAEAAAAQSAIEQANVTKAQMLAEAQALAQKTALDSAHEAYQSVKEQCDACQKRLARAEERLQRSEQRMQISEQRLAESDDRARKSQAALRAIVRVMDANDPTQIDAAITAARELI